MRNDRCSQHCSSAHGPAIQDGGSGPCAERLAVPGTELWRMSSNAVLAPPSPMSHSLQSTASWGPGGHAESKDAKAGAGTSACCAVVVIAAVIFWPPWHAGF